jgi:hypothetical protein
MTGPATIETYRNRLPLFPFATDDLQHGLRMFPQDLALQRALIQHNPRHSVTWLVYDLDSPEASTLFLDDPVIPAPNILSVNRDNGHAHYLYGLDTPVHAYEGASEKALRYMAAVDIALTEVLKADPGYRKLISKNPTNAKWATAFPRMLLYSLDELADYLDLDRYTDRRRKFPPVGYGRNVSLFESLRRWAYQERRQGYLSEDMFFHAVRNHALVINGRFEIPLSHGEVRSTARSVAKWTWQNMNPDSFREWGDKRRAQSIQTKKARAAETREKILQAVKECPQLSQGDIAAMLGLTRRTVVNHLRAIRQGEKRVISDKRGVISPF